MNKQPGLKEIIIYLRFADHNNYYKKKDIIVCSNNTRLKVLQTPHKKWWKQLFQFISFGLYKVPIQYKCKLVK